MPTHSSLVQQDECSSVVATTSFFGLDMKTTGYSAVIGLEIHVQLCTQRKMFAPEGAVYGLPPNTQTSPISLGHPGSMPMPNKQAIEYAIKMGLACGARITRYNHFDRKHYYYVDLPKGYQITQEKTPICREGEILVEIPGQEPSTIRIERIHLEEDTGKSIHAKAAGVTLVNFDRAGIPLIEIVTKPDLRNPMQAVGFLNTIRRLVRYLGISNGNMEEGSLRCDANVSVMPMGSNTLGNKVEIKNMNSIHNVKLAIAYEIKRQIDMKQQDRVVVSETRSYDVEQHVTVYQRKKEGLTEYGFFPEPDLSPFIVDETWLATIQEAIPALPGALVKRFREVYGLSKADALVLTDEKEMGLFFDNTCKHTTHYKQAANWIMGPVRSYLNEEKIDWSLFPLAPKGIADLTNAVAEGLIAFSIAAQDIFPRLLKEPSLDVYALVHKEGVQVNDDEQLEVWVAEALAAYPDKVATYRSGKRGLISWFMGEIMKRSDRKAHPGKVTALLKAHLEAK